MPLCASNWKWRTCLFSCTPSIAVFVSISSSTQQITTSIRQLFCALVGQLCLDLWIFLTLTRPIFFSSSSLIGVLSYTSATGTLLFDGEAQPMRKGCPVRISHVLTRRLRQWHFLGTPSDYLWWHLFQSLLFISCCCSFRSCCLVFSYLRVVCTVSSVSLVLKGRGGGCLWNVLMHSSLVLVNLGFQTSVSSP